MQAVAYPGGGGHGGHGTPFFLTDKVRKKVVPDPAGTQEVLATYHTYDAN